MKFSFSQRGLDQAKHPNQSKPRNPYQSDGKNNCSSTVTSVVFLVAFLYSSTATSFAFYINNDIDILIVIFFTLLTA